MRKGPFYYFMKISKRLFILPFQQYDIQSRRLFSFCNPSSGHPKDTLPFQISMGHFDRCFFVEQKKKTKKKKEMENSLKAKSLFQKSEGKGNFSSCPGE